MTDRLPLAQHTKASLDRLYTDLDRARTLADPELHGRLTAAIAALGKSETELAGLRAAATRTRTLAGRIRQGVPWTANDDDIAAHIMAALDGDQAPAASCSPDATETEPNNPRTTVDNPATSSDWTPPPPGDRREQLPDRILNLISIPPYTSTACETAQTLRTTAEFSSRNVDELQQHADQLHTRCRLQNKFTGVPCDCPCHRQAATLNSAAPNASRIEPDPPVAS